MVVVFLKAIGIWLLMVALAIINAGIREKILDGWIGGKASLVLSGITLSLFIFGLVWLMIPFLSLRRVPALVGIGLFWALLTLAFEFGFGHFVMKKSFAEIAQVFNIFTGNLMLLVIFVTALSPYLAAVLRGLLR